MALLGRFGSVSVDRERTLQILRVIGLCLLAFGVLGLFQGVVDPYYTVREWLSTSGGWRAFLIFSAGAGIIAYSALLELTQSRA